MNKDIRKIFFVTALYSFAGGLFYNFLELWLINNKFSISEVSLLYSMGAFATGFVIILFSYYIKQKNLQNFLLTLLITNSIVFYLMYQINGLGFKDLIVFLFVIVYVIDIEIYVLLYPLIATIEKNDKLYAKRGLVYDSVYYIACFVSGLLIGRKILTYKFTYNSFAIIGTFILFIAVVILLNVNIDKYIKDDKAKKRKSFIKSIKKFKNDKISSFYLLFSMFVNISRFCILGVIMIILTTKLGFSDSFASNIKLVFNISSVLLASIILRKMTFKNNYINIFIKYGIRAILYLVAIVFFNDVTLLIALGYTMISLSSYADTVDAPYINRYEGNEQITFVNIKEMVNYLSRSIGTLICGFCLVVSLKLNLWFSLITIIIAITFACLAYHYLKKEKAVKD